MRRLDPDDPADRPLIARNVTSMGVAVYLLVVVVSLGAVVFVRPWQLRLIYGSAAVIGGAGLAYYLWMFREVRRNATFAASFRHRPRPVVGVEHRKFVMIAVFSLAILVIGPRLFGPRMGVLIAAIVVLAIWIAMMRSKR